MRRAAAEISMVCVKNRDASISLYLERLPKMSSTYGSRLDGVMVLVTGASSGIGRAVAKYLGEAGASVAINYHMQREAAEVLARELREAGGSAVALGGDVSRESDVITLFDNVVREFGRLDVLIANSGMQKDAPIADMTLEDWNAVIEVDLTGQFLCCRQAVRQFRTQPAQARPFRSSGSIIAITSVHDRIPWAGHSNYTASKGGARMFIETLAQEVAGDGIRVNAIAPGAIRSSINRDVWDDKAELEKLLRLIPYGRIGEPEDVARAAAWLASDEADYVTGVTLYVDGGMMLYPSFRDNG